MGEKSRGKRLINLYHGDCLQVMNELPENSVDLVVCDLPYGFTDAEWDNIIPFAEMWGQYRRLLKPKGRVVLFGNQPFTTKLIHSNLNDYSHMWYWIKNTASGALNAKKQPMRCVEDIVVFTVNANTNKGKHKNLRQYFFDELEKSGLKRIDIDKLLNSSMSSHYFTHGEQFSIPSKSNYEKLQSTGYFQRPYEDIKREYLSGKKSTTPIYNPQGVRKLEKPKKKTVTKSNQSALWGSVTPKEYQQTMTGYPKNTLYFDNVQSCKKLHPTEKPVALLEYLIKTYSNENDVVLDNCMGSGSTGSACINTNRRFIGIEKDKRYFDIAKSRLNCVNKTA